MTDRNAIAVPTRRSTPKNNRGNRPQGRRPLPPTQNELGIAVSTYADWFGLNDEQYGELFTFATGSVHTAIGMMEVGVMTKKVELASRIRNPKVRDQQFKGFLKELKDANREDRQNARAEDVSKEDADTLLLRGLNPGRPMRLGRKATEVILSWMVPGFNAPRKGELHQKDLPRLVRRNLRLFRWLAENTIPAEPRAKFLEEFEAAMGEDKADRAAMKEAQAQADAAATPVPDAEEPIVATDADEQAPEAAAS